MENCLPRSRTSTSSTPSTSRPRPAPIEALKAVGKEKAVLVVSVDGGCPGVKNVAGGIIGATSQQYPLLMASMGIEAIAASPRTAPSRRPSAGLEFFNTGVTLITDKPANGVESIDTKKGLAQLLGLMRRAESLLTSARAADRLPLRLKRRGQAPGGEATEPWLRHRNSRMSSQERHRGRCLRTHVTAPIERAQHFLHSNPAAVPLIVLVLSVALFGAVIGTKFFYAFRCADPPAGGDLRHRRRRADAGDPDRRHRSVGRRHHGAVVGGHGPVHIPLRPPGADVDSLRLWRRRAVRLDQRRAGRPCEAAALHRHARHLADLSRHQFPLFGQRDHPQPGHRRAGADAAVLRHTRSATSMFTLA